MAKTNAVKKVGSENQQSNTEDKKKKGRVDFPIKNAKCVNENGAPTSAVNAEGKLTAVPVAIKDSLGTIVYEGYDPRKHKPLKKDVFASVAVYLRYQAYVVRLRAERFVKLAEDKERKADNLEKFGDEETRKKAQKVQRMREQLAALEEQLKAEGINIEEPKTETGSEN